MARIAEIKRERLSPRQQQPHDAFLRSRPRKMLTGPFFQVGAAAANSAAQSTMPMT